MSDVLIMGGGFAGSPRPAALAAAGRRVTVLEKRPVLGGRAYSYTDQTTGEVIDNGQHAMMGCYTEMFRFLDRIGATDKLAIQPGLRVDMLDPDRGAGVISCRRCRIRCTWVPACSATACSASPTAPACSPAVSGCLWMKRRRDPRLAALTVDGRARSARTERRPRAGPSGIRSRSPRSTTIPRSRPRISWPR